jgi:hypothetical protein
LYVVDAIGVNQVRGLPFRVDEMVAALRSVINGTADRTKIGSAGRFGTMNGVPTIEVGIEDQTISHDALSDDLPVSPARVGTNGASR